MGIHTESKNCNNRKALKPLSTSAVDAANKAQAKCDSQAERKNWMDKYIKAGGAWECVCPKEKKPKDPKPPCPLCGKAHLIVKVIDDAKNPVEGAIVNVDSIGGNITTTEGFADYGQVEPGTYSITGEIERASSSPDDPAGFATNTTILQPDETKLVVLKLQPTLVLANLTVIKNATQSNVTGAKNWATIKKASNNVIVEARTFPNNDEAEWNQITWSGDSGDPVPGKPNQRSLSRSASKKYHVEAELGGEKKDLDVWVLWATIVNKVTGTTPANAVQNGAGGDGTENLGARSFNHGTEAVGKVVSVAVITPLGVHNVVQSGWTFKRERMSHDWGAGVKDSVGNGVNDYWNTRWVDDTSHASWLRLTPDNGDKLYDSDAPNIANFGGADNETYNNFRQWIEWDGDECSDKEGWYWKGRWKRSSTPQVEFKDVGTGSIILPNDSHYHP